MVRGDGATRAPAWLVARNWLFSTDHVRVGVLWVAATLLFFFLGGLAAFVIRSELAFPGLDFLSPDAYGEWFTLHGTFMVFFFAVPVFFGVGSIVVPRMIGTDNLAFPRLNSFDFWLILLGGLVLEAGFAMGDRPMAGWTSYTPLSLNEYSPGLGQDWWLWAILIETIGGTLAGVNFAATIVRNRRPGLRLTRMPVLAWAMLFTSFLTMFAGPILIVALLLMFLDRHAGTLFFDPSSPHGALLWQDLFWFYSHPATYVMVIPAFGVLSAVIARFARRPLFHYGAIVAASGAVTALGFMVWWHHMFTTGMDVAFRMFGAVATWAIAIPSGVLVLTWIASLRGGRIRFTTPMLFALGWILMFTMGGVNGLYMAYVPFDRYAHDTYWLVAHFHYIIFGGTVLGTFAAIYYWFPGALGLALDESLGKIHFWGTFIGMNLTFFPMHFAGLAGMPRRVYDYDPGLAGINFVETAGMFLIAGAMAVFLGNVASTVLRRRRVRDDPWGPLPEDVSSARDAEEPHATTQKETTEDRSYWPALAALGVLLVAVGLTLSLTVAVAGVVTGVVAGVGWAREVQRVHGGSAVARARPDEPDVPEAWARARSVGWWLTVGLVAASAMAFAAALRVLVAHGLLVSEAWAPPAQDLLTIRAALATLLVLGAAAAAVLAARAAGRGDGSRALRSAFASAVAGAAFVVVMFVEWVALADAGFVPASHVSASAYYAVTGYHVATVAAGAIAVAGAAWRSRRDALWGARAGALRATALYWTFLAVAWIITIVVMYARLVPWEGTALLEA